jgi:hypothetical protein
MIDLAVTKQTWIYARQSGTATVIVAINNGSDNADIPVHFGGDAEFPANWA